MISQKTHRDIAFHGAMIAEGGITVLNKEELEVCKQKLIGEGLTYHPCNSKKMKVKIDGIPTRQFHLLVLQFPDNSSLDFMGLLLFGFMVEGWIWAFDTKKDRDKFANGFTIASGWRQEGSIL